jgi:hypothetical protein
VRLGRRLDIPFDQRRVDGLRDLVSEYGLAGSRLSLDQQRTPLGDRSIDCDLEILGRDIAAGALETIDHTRFSFTALRKR